MGLRLSLCVCLLSLLAAPALAEDLSGEWRIEIVAGPSQGDHGLIALTPLKRPEEEPGVRYYSGAMRFTDARAKVTAEETCLVADRGEQVTVRCQTEQPGWLPDDFDLKKSAPGEMRGPHISAVSGEALFRRMKTPDLTS